MPAAIQLARRYDVIPPALSFNVLEGSGSARVLTSAVERSSPGQEIAGSVALELSFSRDGVIYAPLAGAGSGPFDQSYSVSAAQPLWFRARACDRNRNCVEQTAGPFDGAATAGGPSRTTSPGSIRARVLLAGVTRCAAARRGCLRITWRTSLTGVDRVRYSISVSRVGFAPLLARGAGRTSARRRIVVVLPLRRGPICGRLLVRIRVTHAGASDAVRRYLVLPACGRA
jgi:hypothetical protein